MTAAYVAYPELFVRKPPSRRLRHHGGAPTDIAVETLLPIVRPDLPPVRICHVSA
ncbi:MAG: hypothetical protein ACREQM_04605 [Candidatus Dormibacteraceae bacterium]